MQFKDSNNEVIEPVKWQWIADYGDGQGIRQFDSSDGSYHYFKEIDHDKTKRFGLVSPSTGKSIIIDIPEGAKLIHFYDNLIQHPLGGTAIHHRLFAFGYECKNEKRIISILPNDFVVEIEPSKIEVL